MNDVPPAWKFTARALVPAPVPGSPAAPPTASAQPLASTSNTFRALWDLGYRTLVPVIPPDALLSPLSRLSKRLETSGKDSRGKTPGIKGIDGLWRSFNWNGAVATPKLLDEWHAMGAGVGIVASPESRLIGIDVDTLDIDHSANVLETLRSRLVGPMPARFGRAPKFLIMARVSGDDLIVYRRAEFVGAGGATERVELICAARYFNVDTIHPGTGKPYTWTGPIPRFDELPVLSLGQLDALFREIADTLPGGQFVAGKKLPSAAGATVNRESLKGAQDDIRRAVAAIPNTSKHFPTYDDYVAVGYAIKGASQDWPSEGQELFEEWADRWDGGDNDRAASDWPSFRDPRIGAQWLYDKAEALGAGAFDKASLYVAPIAEEPTSLFDLAPLQAVAGMEERSRFPAIVSIGGAVDAKAIPTREWLIYPWCPANTVSAIVGAPGVSKSAFTLMVAVVVSSGVEAVLRGKDRLSAERLHKRGPVLLYNREDDLHEMQRRVRGICSHFGLGAFPNGLHIASGTDGRLVIVERKERGGQVTRAPGFEWLRGQIRRLRPVLVVIEPLIALSSNLEENSNDDMEALLAELRVLAAEEKTTIIVVHHSGKAAGKASSGDMAASRGASAIMGAVRGGLTLTLSKVAEMEQDGPLKGLTPGSYVLAEGIKANYGPKADPVVYRLQPVAVGNGTGDPLPDNAELLFDEQDAGAFLARTGDTVVVHEIVDRRGADAKAKAVAVARAEDKMSKLARIVQSVLGDQPSIKLNDAALVLAEPLKAAGLIVGTSLPPVRKAIIEALETGVRIKRADGQSVLLRAVKESRALKSAWLITQESTPDDAGDRAWKGLFA